MGSKEVAPKGNSHSQISTGIKMKYEFLNYTLENSLSSNLQICVTFP
jgi:hypothetical protein